MKYNSYSSRKREYPLFIAFIFFPFYINI